MRSVGPKWAGNDEAGDLGQPRAFGAAEAATEIGSTDPGPRKTLSTAELVLLWVIALLCVAWLASLATLFDSFVQWLRS